MKLDSDSTVLFNQQCYDRWANSYDSEPNSTIAADDLAFPAVWSHVRGKRVLEIGCGTGRHTVRLVALGNCVTAIDLSDRMLQIARERVKSSQVEFIHGDFLRLANIPLEHFDAVIVSLVLEHIPDTTQFFRKVAGSLRTGGEFFLSEIHPDRIAKGAQANFIDAESGARIKLASFAHRSEEILAAGRRSVLNLIAEQDVVGNSKMARCRPEWQKHLGKPLVKIWCFRK